VKVEIARVTIGTRIRKDLGNIQELAGSIAEIGLLHPIVVTPDLRLICGARRIAACQSLGLLDIEATVLDLADIVQGEFAENEYRKDFTWSERVEISKTLEPLEKDEARKRKATNNTERVNFTPSETGNALDKLAAAVGTSRPTLLKAREIYDSGDEALIEKMDQTGKVDGVYRDLKKRERDERLKDVPPPVGKYRVIYADPPWYYGDKLIEGYGSAEHHYPTLTITELCALPVKDLLDNDAVLFMWVTSPLLAECFAVIAAWGFEYKASFVWDKVKHNFGHYNSVRHELLLICARGSCLPENGKLFDSVVELERTPAHSQKPERFREMIDEMYPSGNRIELFARGHAPNGWVFWGDQAWQETPS